MKKLIMQGDEHRRRWLVLTGVVVFAVAIVAGSWFFIMHGDRSASHGSRVTSHESRLYHCPMHPTYTSDKPGECPICGMNLVLVEEDDENHEGHETGKQMSHEKHEAMKQEDREPPDRAPIKVSETQRQAIGVKNARAEPRFLSKEIRTVGTVAYDPGLAVAQKEYIDALGLGDSALAGAAAERLELMGMSKDQIAGLRRTRRIQKNLYLPAPDGTAWIYGEIYETDIPYISIGQAIEVIAPDIEGLELTGTIAAIDPVVNPKTRTMRIRTEVADPARRLKPNLYVDVIIRVPLGESLAVPSSALVWSDKAWHVFVDEGNGRLVPREVTVGGRTRDYAQITAGLREGEKVVTSANFLIDAESQLKATLRDMKGGVKGHDH